MTAEGSYARGWSGSCRANEFLVVIASASEAIQF